MTDADDILQRLTGTARKALDALEVFAELESTNTYLLRQTGPLPGRFRAVIADHQTAGRGRQGKSWIAPPSSGLCLSLAYTFVATPANLSSLTLATGVGIAAALREIGVRDAALKWPNDLVARDGKLGGILTETHSDGGSSRTVIVGVGLNVNLPGAMRHAPPLTWIGKISDLAECMGTPPDRAELSAAILECLIDAIGKFEREGFDTFRSAWPTYDWLEGKTVSVEQAPGRIAGIADGIDANGALLVRTDTGTKRVVSGSVAVPDYAVACA
jgi:BirA family biotin operon repressor/biotin-[acetyl-CoA-carboxylase] ligase